MSYLAVYGIGLLVTLALMTLLWLISLALKNSSIVDIFWGTGFVIVNAVYFALSPEGNLARQGLITRPAGHGVGLAPVDPRPHPQLEQRRGFPLPQMA